MNLVSYSLCGRGSLASNIAPFMSGFAKTQFGS